MRGAEDMQRFVDNYPELRAKTNAAGKHVTLCGELARLVESRRACGRARAAAASVRAAVARLRLQLRSCVSE